MPFAFLLAALAVVPDPRRAQGQRYSMSYLLLFSVLAVLDPEPTLLSPGAISGQARAVMWVRMSRSKRP